VRRPTSGEALAAARIERSRGHVNSAVRWLVAGAPELGTVAMIRAPEALVHAYLPLEWKQELKDAARDAGVAPWLVAGVARQESLFFARARSPRGALGVLQLLPATARPHARALGLGSQPDLFDPAVNLRIGARELARLIRRFGAIEPALAAYNAGETRARRWWRQWPESDRFTEAVPIPETYNYIRRVLYLAEAYRLVYEPEWRQP
jgi:soluble lytic murein transglycosylase